VKLVLKSVLGRLDGFTVALATTVGLAALLPARGQVYDAFALSSKLVVASLFFMHGVKLSPANLWAGLKNWRLHLTITAATFVFFPLAGLALQRPFASLVGDNLLKGLLFVCALPATVQSSIAFTSIARGNVAAAVCSASGSSLLGVFLTPLLVNLLLHAQAAGSLSQTVVDLCLQLVLPFVLGQALRPKLAAWVERRKKMVGRTDRLSVLFIVYVSFSRGVSSGLFSDLSWPIFGALILCCGVLLTAALAATYWGGRLLGFPRADRATIIFCGSKKSLVSGVPMANVIFSPALASVIILPLMIFHQMQLVACSLLARRMALQAAEPDGPEGSSGL
jgi:sodium/bile acid cotransporter 7